jgi:hypothetical protein
MRPQKSHILTYAEEGIEEIKFSQGKVHNYFGTMLDNTMPDKLKHNMNDYVKTM